MTVGSNVGLAIRIADLGSAEECARIEGFIDDHGATPFHRPAWLKAVELGTGQRAFGLVAQRKGVVEGWLPLTEIRSAFFPATLVSSGFGIGGGPLANEAAVARELLRASQEFALRFGATSIELRGGAGSADWDEVSGKHANFVRPLAHDRETELANIPRKARAEVRKALASPLEIVVGTSQQDLAAHFHCYSRSVRNLGTPVFPRKLFAAVTEHLAGNVEILTAVHEGRPVSSVLSLYHDGTVMPYWGGGSREARALKANERVYFELMDHARARGCAQFDFGRSKVGSGPYQFKKLWGFEPDPLTYHSWTAPGSKARNIDPTDAGYSSRIGIWKKLPLAIANRIGPAIARGLG